MQLLVVIILVALLYELMKRILSIHMLNCLCHQTHEFNFVKRIVGKFRMWTLLRVMTLQGSHLILSFQYLHSLT